MCAIKSNFRRKTVKSPRVHTHTPSHRLGLYAQSLYIEWQMKSGFRFQSSAGRRFKSELLLFEDTHAHIHTHLPLHTIFILFLCNYSDQVLRFALPRCVTELCSRKPTVAVLTCPHCTVTPHSAQEEKQMCDKWISVSCTVLCLQSLIPPDRNINVVCHPVQGDP